MLRNFLSRKSRSRLAGAWFFGCKSNEAFGSDMMKSRHGNLAADKREPNFEKIFSRLNGGGGLRSDICRFRTVYPTRKTCNPQDSFTKLLNS